PVLGIQQNAVVHKASDADRIETLRFADPTQHALKMLHHHVDRKTRGALRTQSDRPFHLVKFQEADFRCEKRSRNAARRNIEAEDGHKNNFELRISNCEFTETNSL